VHANDKIMNPRENNLGRSMDWATNYLAKYFLANLQQI
jgi:hypothetical protein